MMLHARNTGMLLLLALMGATTYNTFSGRGIPWVPTVDVKGPQPRLVLSSSAAAINYIDLQEASAKYQQKATFLDAREASQYAEGHIRGALLVPGGATEEVIASKLAGTPKDATIVVYCDGEECGSSMAVAGKLQRLGFSKVDVFFGGWAEWQAAGLPTEKGSKLP